MLGVSVANVNCTRLISGIGVPVSVCIATLVMLAIIACSPSASRTPAAQKNKQALQVNQTNLAQVGPLAISRQEVVALSALLAFDPQTTLRRLEHERLLYLHAQALGYAQRAEVKRAQRQALVRNYLKTSIEAKLAEPTRAELESYYHAHAERYTQPERRGSKHVLFVVPSGASAQLDKKAYVLALDAIKALKTARAIDAVIAHYADLRTLEGLTVRAEEVPVLPRNARADEAYMKALFAGTRSGVVGQPVRSRFGWHAIMVTTLIPATHQSLEHVLPSLKKEMLEARRAAALKQQLAGLRRQTQIKRRADVEHEVLSESFYVWNDDVY